MNLFDKLFRPAEGGYVKGPANADPMPMIDEDDDNPIITLAPFTLIFPALFKPKAIDPFAAPKFMGGALFKSDDNTVGMLSNICTDLALRKFGMDKPWQSPIKTHSSIEYLNLLPRVHFSSKIRPIVKTTRNGLVYFAREEEVYAGCICTAEVMPFAYDTPQFRGVGLSMLSVTKIMDAQITEDQAQVLMDIENFVKRGAA